MIKEAYSPDLESTIYCDGNKVWAVNSAGLNISIARFDLRPNVETARKIKRVSIAAIRSYQVSGTFEESLSCSLDVPFVSVI